MLTMVELAKIREVMDILVVGLLISDMAKITMELEVVMMGGKDMGTFIMEKALERM